MNNFARRRRARKILVFLMSSIFLANVEKYEGLLKIFQNTTKVGGIDPPVPMYDPIAHPSAPLQRTRNETHSTPCICMLES